jgi:hypothetical protein
MIVSMADQVTLRPVEENDLQILEDLTQNPEKAGEFSWFGWYDPRRYRRRWAEASDRRAPDACRPAA